jgi:hypothetical protein
MDEFITFIRDRNSPAAAMLAFMKEATTEFRRDLVGCSLGGCGVRKIQLAAPWAVVASGKSTPSLSQMN